jgi:hypothetical protein
MKRIPQRKLRDSSFTRIRDAFPLIPKVRRNHWYCTKCKKEKHRREFVMYRGRPSICRECDAQ